MIGRKLQVKLSNFISSAVNVTSGVPQGEHLSLILFLLFINNVKDIFKNSHFWMFGDDLKLYMPINSRETCFKFIWIIFICGVHLMVQMLMQKNADKFRFYDVNEGLSSNIE